MRLKVLLPDDSEYRKAMIHSEPNGATYLFLFTTEENRPCVADYWFTERAEALEWAEYEYGIAIDTWIEIPDRLPGQQQDLEYDEHGALL